MVRRYGLDAYTVGFNVFTTIDSRLQVAARKALRIALLEYDRRHGFRGRVGRLDLADIIPESTGVGRRQPTSPMAAHARAK